MSMEDMINSAAQKGPFGTEEIVPFDNMKVVEGMFNADEKVALEPGKSVAEQIEAIHAKMMTADSTEKRELEKILAGLENKN